MQKHLQHDVCAARRGSRLHSRDSSAVGPYIGADGHNASADPVACIARALRSKPSAPSSRATRLRPVSARTFGRRAGGDFHPRQSLSRRRRPARTSPSTFPRAPVRKGRACLQLPLRSTGRRQGARRHRYDRTRHYQACRYERQGRQRRRAGDRARAHARRILRRGTGGATPPPRRQAEPPSLPSV